MNISIKESYNPRKFSGISTIVVFPFTTVLYIGSYLLAYLCHICFHREQKTLFSRGEYDRSGSNWNSKHATGLTKDY